jgi:hypothetical protein
MIASFVQLDPALQEGIALVVTFVVSYLLLQLAALSPILAAYLGQYKVGIIVWVTGLAVQLIQAELNKIPANWDEVVFLVMKLLAEVLLVLFGFAAIRSKKVKGYQALLPS